MGRVRSERALKGGILAVALLTVGALSSGLVLGQGRPEHRRQGPPLGPMPPLPPILEKAIRASAGLRYSGERTVEFKRGVERMRHRELILKDGPRLRIEFPDDSPMRGQVIVETGAQRLHYFPDRNEIEVNLPRRDEALSRLEMFLRGRAGKPGRRIEVGPNEEVANLRAELVSIVDPEGRASMKMWIEPRSGMILKREMLDPSGSLVGMFEFTRVNLNPLIRKEDFTIEVPDAKRVTPVDKARVLMRQYGLAEVFLPPDSGLQLEHVRTFEIEGKTILLLLYRGKEGLVSLYQFAGTMDRSNFMRRLPKEFRSFNWMVSGRSFVLIGPAADGSLERIAKRLQPD